MALHGLDHYNIETIRPEETIAFYRDVLDCVNAPEQRPPSSRPGTWLLVDDHPAIHVNFVDEERAAPTGALHHVAFAGSGFAALCARLDDLGIEYKSVESPRLNLQQIFVIDPNNIRVEINISGELNT